MSTPLWGRDFDELQRTEAGDRELVAVAYEVSALVPRMPAYPRG